MPAASNARARWVGRWGWDLELQVDAEDAGGDVLFLDVELRDGADAPLVAFDTDRDGSADAPRRRHLFDRDPAGAQRFTGTVTLPRFADVAAGLASVTLTVEDASGQRSRAERVAVTAQAERAEGEACDPAALADRCPTGQACGGDPARCSPGTAPEVLVAAYTDGVDSPVLRVAGADADDDVVALRVAYLSAGGAPVAVDLNGDGTPDASSFDVAVLDSPGLVRGGGGFFVETPLGLNLPALAPRLALTPVDSAGREGPSFAVEHAPLAARAVGEECDLRGLDRCAAGFVCAPGADGAAPTCVNTAGLLAERCASAPVLNAAPGFQRVFGRTAAPGLFEPPAECSPTWAVGRPDFAVRVRIPPGVSGVTLRTALPETSIDTVLTVLPACNAPPDAALACIDDSPGLSTSSEVSLDTPAAGELLVIVDGTATAPGTVGLELEVR